MKSIFIHNGKSIQYQSEVIAGVLWVHVNGKTFSLENKGTQNRHRKTSEKTGQTKVVSPMPGKVTKVMVSVGDQIEKGSAVLVMEAMKMEYTLKAEISGSVKKVYVDANAQVGLGQLLVELEEVSK